MNAVLFSLAAMLCWGVGDFLIQRSLRATDFFLVLVVSAGAGVVLLAPWAFPALVGLQYSAWALLGLLGIVLTVAAFCEFEALRQGKLAIVDMLFSIEIPVTIALAVALHQDVVTLRDSVLIGFLFGGLLLLSFKRFSLRKTFERGALLALLGGAIMGFANFLTADASHRISPVLAIWFPCVVLLVAASLALARSIHRTGQVPLVARSTWVLLGVMATIDTLAWLFYALATAPGETAITTAITQGYPAIALALGVYFNNERISKQQWAGALLAFSASIALAVTR